MARPATVIKLTKLERTQLESWVRQPKAEARLVERARIILWAADGLTNQAIAARLDTRPARICKWRLRFDQERLAGLADDFRPGRVPSMTKRPGNDCWRSWIKLRPKVTRLGPARS